MSSTGSKSQKTATRAKPLQMKMPAKSKPKRKAPRGESSRVTVTAGNLTSRKEKPYGTGFGSTRRRQVIIEDEYIADIYGSVAFATTKFPFNPGQSTTFPWASRIAANYERYRVINAEFYYKRMVSEYANNGQSGKVIMSFDYDASDPAPINKQQVEDTDPHVDCLPSEEMTLRLDPAMLNSQDSKYIRPGAQPANTDIKTYDGGNLFVSTVGNNSTAVVGELHVKYTIELIVPILEVLSGAYGGSFTSGGTTSAANVLGTTPTSNAANLNVTVDGLSNITFAALGTYLVSINMVGTGLSALTVTPSAGAAVTQLAIDEDGSALHDIGVYQVVISTVNSTIAVTATATTVTSSAVYIGTSPAASL